MLYLTHRLADLDKLEPVYLYIWQKVNLARNEEEFSTEKIKEDVLNELYGIIKKEDLKKLDSELNTEQIDEIWGNLIKANVLDSQGKLLKQSIDSDFGFDDYRDRINYLLNEQVKREKQVYVPNYLKPFVEHSLEAWIKNAKRARFDVHEGYHYQVGGDMADTSINRGLQVIITDRDTGVDLKNTKWQEGLHQFVELKHCCKLSTQSLKAVFISNVSFLKEYDKLYGLTGTLGSKVERESLKEIHNIDFITVPTSKPKRFVEEVPELCGGVHEWIEKIRSEAKKLTQDEGRSVLIVCNSVNDAETLEKAFEEAEEAFGKDTPNVHTYKRDYEPFDVVQGSRKLKQGEIIIATNLAGRGTDIKLTDELKDAGGLHVCLAYLPDNLRIEQQAFGRAARSGDPGSGNLIIIDPSKGKHEIMELKGIRNNEEVVRVSKIQSHYVNKIQKEEECFKMFSEQYKKLNKSLIENGTPEKVKEILLESCLDKWAFWLDRNSKGIETKTKEEVIEQCEEFISGLSNLSPRNWPAWVHDPVQIVKLAKYFVEIEKYDTAISLFNKVINEEPLFSEAAHYYKAFTLVKKIDWAKAKKRSEGEDKEALRELKAELQQAEKLFSNRSKFFAAASAIVDKIEEDINGETRVIQNDFYREQKEELSKLYNVFSQSVDDILSRPVTPQSLMNCDITKELAEKLHEKLLKKGILKKLKVKKNISEKELKNISLEHGISVEVLTNFLSKFQGKEIDEKEFQKELKKNIPLPSKEAFWKHLVKEDVLYEEIKYVVVNKTKLEVVNPTLFEELSTKVTRGELQNKVLHFETQGMAFLNPTQDNDNSYTFRKGEFIKAIGEERYAELKRKGTLSFNRAAHIREDRISSVTLPEYNSVTLEDFISKSNISEDEAKKVLEDLVDKGVLRLADDNKYQLVDQNIDMRFPVYEKAVTKSLSSCFIYKLALEDVEDQVRNGSYPIHLRIAAKPHRELMWELVRQRIIKPVRVDAKAKDLKEKVGNIYNEITTEQEEEIREVTVNSIVQALEQLKSPLKALKVPDSSLKSIIEESITSWANIEELSTVFFNGLDTLIKLDERKWTKEMFIDTSVALFLGVTQISIGSAIEVYSSGILNRVASGVINMGISDIVFATRALCSGHFSWEGYKQNKIYSISSAALLTGAGILGAKVGLQIGKAISVGQNVQKAEYGKRVIDNIINCTTGGIVLALSSKVVDRNVEALVAGSRANIRAEISSKMMEELRNHGVIQSLRTSYNVLGKDEAKKMIDHLINNYQMPTMNTPWVDIIGSRWVTLLKSCSALAQPMVNPFLNNMQRQIDARLRGRDAIEGNHDEIEYQNFEQEVINQWRLRLCKEVEQVIIDHSGPALSSALSCSMLLAKRLGKEGEVGRASVNSGIYSKEEMNKVLQDPIKVNLVRQLKSRLDQLQKQNLNPPSFISEPALSQINTLNKYIGN